jgi:DNA-directed RNA polymerase specialized sigma24 family protein
MDAKKDVLSENRTVPLFVAVIDEQNPTGRQVIEAARALNLASAESLAILEMVYVHGWSSARVAEARSMSSESVRQRCSDTVRRLRTHRDELAEAVEFA